jgi:hypothetical protein
VGVTSQSAASCRHKPLSSVGTLKLLYQHYFLLCLYSTQPNMETHRSHENREDPILHLVIGTRGDIAIPDRGHRDEGPVATNDVPLLYRHFSIILSFRSGKEGR